MTARSPHPVRETGVGEQSVERGAQVGLVVDEQPGQPVHDALSDAPLGNGDDRPAACGGFQWGVAEGFEPRCVDHRIGLSEQLTQLGVTDSDPEVEVHLLGGGKITYQGGIAAVGHVADPDQTRALARDAGDRADHSLEVLLRHDCPQADDIAAPGVPAAGPNLVASTPSRHTRGVTPYARSTLSRLNEELTRTRSYARTEASSVRA